MGFPTGIKKGPLFRLLAPGSCLHSLRLIDVADEDGEEDDSDRGAEAPHAGATHAGATHDAASAGSHQLTPWSISDTLAGHVPTARFTRSHRFFSHARGPARS